MYRVIENHLFFCRISSRICFFVLFFSIGILPQQVQAEFEKPGTLKAQSILKPELSTVRSKMTACLIIIESPHRSVRSRLPRRVP